MACNNKITKSSLLFIYRETFSFQTDLAFALGTGFYLHLYLSVQRIYDNIATQNGRVQVDVQVGIQVVSFPFELRVVFYHKGYVKVAGRCSIGTFLTMSFKFDNLTVFHTGRNSDTQCLSTYGKGLLMRNGCLTQG